MRGLRREVLGEGVLRLGIMTGYVYIKVHMRGNVMVLAICDEELLGRKFEEGIFTLEVKEDFYGDRRVPIDDELFKLIDEAHIVNMVGSRIVEEAIRRGVVPREGVLKIAGIPHVQVVKLF